MFDITKKSYEYNVGAIELELKLKYASIPNGLKEYMDKRKEEEREERRKQIDSVKIKKLRRYFRVKKDEFSNADVCWYTPIGAPEYINRNGIYCYFQTKYGVAENLRLRIQYCADNWLFFKKIQFAIDGIAYEYVPEKVEYDNDGGEIWEWSDENVLIQRSIVNALANGKNAKMKFVGRQYDKIIRINKRQLIDIKRTIDLYEAMGGKYY